MTRKWLKSLWQRRKQRRMIAAINVLEKLTIRELKDIADYAVELYKHKLEREAQP